LGVTALCPGLVDTNLFSAAPRGRERQENKLPPTWLLATPESIARRAIRAIYRNQAVVVVQPYARLLHLAKRLAPGLLDLANGFRRRDAAARPISRPADDTHRRAA
jgi:short-subunit dehydrogenase